MDKKEFIEIVNWEKAQPLMKGENNPWLKMYTSVLDNDCIEQLDDRSYRLATYLWALAARMGTKYLRADTDWLKRRMATFPGEPDLEPLMNVKDIHGKPAPFIRYCDAPGQEENSELSSQEPVGKQETENRKQDVLYDKCVAFMGALEYISARALSDKFKINWKRANNIVKSMQTQGLVGGFVKGKGFVVSARAQSEESRVEQKSSSNELLEEKKERINPNGLIESPQSKAARQKQVLLAGQAQDSGRKSVNSFSSMESDESAVITHTLPKPPTSSFRGGHAVPIGRVIRGQFPLHWDSGECEEFGREVILALGIPADKDNEYSKQQWGAFGHWLLRLKGVCPDGAVVGEIKEYMIDKAKWIMSPKCKRKDNPPALLTSIMDGALAKRGLKLPDKRASPA